MHTKTPKVESARVQALRTLLAGPLEIRIDRAEAYWLEDRTGAVLGAESDRTLAPCAQVLLLINAGRDPDDLALWARLRGGERYEVSSGIFLVDMAEGAAGIPPRPRVIRER